MRTIFAEYTPQRNSIDVYTSAGYMLRIDCREAETDLKTTTGSDCALNALAIDEPLEYADVGKFGRFFGVMIFRLINIYVNIYPKIYRYPLDFSSRYLYIIR